MLTFALGLLKGEERHEMSKKTQFDEAKVTGYVERLAHAGCDRAAFNVVLGEIRDDSGLSSSGVQAIAQRYVGGGALPTSKKKALAAIATRFAEVVRASKSERVARNVRVL